MKRSKNKPPQLRQFNPLNDYFFYKIMGEKGSEIQLLSFLNAVLGRKGYDRFTSVEILEDKTFTPELLGDKSVTLPVSIYGKTMNGKWFLRIRWKYTS